MPTRTTVSRLLIAIPAVLFVGSVATAQDDSRAFAENSMQAYLAMWDNGVNAAAVTRFYAPRVVYYGKAMTRGQILDDKLAFTRSWPVRRSKEVPGSFAGKCNVDRSRCEISSLMTWQRIGAARNISNGRARIRLTFAPVDGTHKIVEESAVLQ